MRSTSSITWCHRPVKWTRWRRIVAIAALAATLGGPASALAANCPRTSLGDIEDEVMCTVCGVPLNLATDAPQAQRERAFIVSQIRQCRTKQQIKDQLVAQYGDRVLALPKAKGFGITTYVIPIVGLIAALTLITFAALRWRRKRPERSSGTRSRQEPLPSADAARLEADLDRYDL
jgi:cytochrome c-type biogenesis protein CcmH